MHGAGIYRQRYGLDTALGLPRAAEVQDEVDAFVAEQEAKFGGDPARPLARLRAAPALRPALALLLHARRRDGEAAELQGYRLEPVGPWHVRLAPYPFGERPGRFSLLRRVVPKDGSADVLGRAPEASRSRSTNSR